MLHLKTYVACFHINTCIKLILQMYTAATFPKMAISMNTEDVACLFYYEKR